MSINCSGPFSPAYWPTRDCRSKCSPSRLSETSWVSLSLAVHEKSSPGEFWNALDGRLKPGLQLELSLPLDVFAWVPTAPVAESIKLSMDRLAKPAMTGPQYPTLRRHRAGGALVMEGRPASDPDGTDGTDADPEPVSKPDGKAGADAGSGT